MTHYNLFMVIQLKITAKIVLFKNTIKTLKNDFFRLTTSETNYCFIQLKKTFFTSKIQMNTNNLCCIS